MKDSGKWPKGWAPAAPAIWRPRRLVSSSGSSAATSSEPSSWSRTWRRTSNSERPVPSSGNCCERSGVRWLPALQWSLDPELRRTPSQPGDDLERLCRIDDQSGGEQAHGEAAADALDGAHLLLNDELRPPSAAGFRGSITSSTAGSWPRDLPRFAPVSTSWGAGSEIPALVLPLL